MLADGGMASMLYAEGVDFRRCFEETNLTHPDLVQNIHRRYIAAGAEIIEANTFGANRFKLQAYGLDGKVRDINYVGAKIARDAREVTGEAVFVAGSVGPTGLMLKPGVSVAQEEIAAAYQEQIEGLLEGGVDLLTFETFTDVDELALAIRIAQRVCQLPIIAQATFNEDLHTLAGQSVETVVKALEDVAADVIETLEYRPASRRA